MAKRAHARGTTTNHENKVLSLSQNAEVVSFSPLLLAISLLGKRLSILRGVGEGGLLGFPLTSFFSPEGRGCFRGLFST